MKIGFVCYGNICRSPFAEMYAAKNYGDYSFFSFGFIEEPDRPSPANAIEAAGRFGVDLSSNRSKCLTVKDVQEMDVIFIMDRMNYLMFRNNYSNYLNKVFYLDNNDEISDPFKKDVEEYDKCYKMVSKNIDKLFFKHETRN
jgi:protein-tyrosine phosphatase